MVAKNRMIMLFVLMTLCLWPQTSFVAEDAAVENLDSDSGFEDGSSGSEDGKKDDRTGEKPVQSKLRQWLDNLFGRKPKPVKKDDTSIAQKPARTKSTSQKTSGGKTTDDSLTAKQKADLQKIENELKTTPKKPTLSPQAKSKWYAQRLQNDITLVRRSKLSGLSDAGKALFNSMAGTSIPPFVEFESNAEKASSDFIDRVNLVIRADTEVATTLFERLSKTPTANAKNRQASFDIGISQLEHTYGAGTPEKEVVQLLRENPALAKKLLKQISDMLAYRTKKIKNVKGQPQQLVEFLIGKMPVPDPSSNVGVKGYYQEIDAIVTGVKVMKTVLEARGYRKTWQQLEDEFSEAVKKRPNSGKLEAVGRSLIEEFETHAGLQDEGQVDVGKILNSYYYAQKTLGVGA